MMTTEIESAIRIAVAEAIASLGDNYKGMSCFLYSWKGEASRDNPDFDQQAA